MKSRSAFVATAVVLCGLMFCLPTPVKPQDQSTSESRQLQQMPTVTSLPSKAKRWALVIGVDKYSDPQISQLKGADNDARSLSDALVRYAGFPPDQVILLATDQPAERQPTRINILHKLSNLSSVVPKDGLLLISFAGHGIERGGQAYLIPADSQISDDINLLEESAVSVARMKDRIRSIGVGQVVILLDACRNDPGGRADAPNPLTASYANAFNFDVRNHEVSAFATIFATAVGQRAYEYTEKKQGYFTWAIVERLKGAAANDKGEVTLADLIKYVQETVPKRVAIDLGGGKQQKPFSQMEGYKAEDLVLAVSNPALANASQPSAPTSVDPTAFELSYWETIKNSTNADDFQSYLNKYPDGQFAALARNRLGTLKPANASGDAAGAENIYWDSIKNSNNAADYRAYIKRYPNGVFLDLAKSRLAPFEAAEAAKANEEDIRRRTKTYKVQFLIKMAMGGFNEPGNLSIGPGGLQLLSDSPGGKPQNLGCRDFAEARVENNYIREIQGVVSNKPYRYRFQFESTVLANEALGAVRSFCSGESSNTTSSPGSPTATEQQSTRMRPAPTAKEAARDNVTSPSTSNNYPAKTYDKIRNGSTKTAPEGSLTVSSDGITFTANGGTSLVIKCSEILKVSVSNTDKLLTVKTNEGDHHFNDLVSIFSSSPNLKPLADNIREVCRVPR